MKHNKKLDPVGTSLQGFLNLSYAELKTELGQPMTYSDWGKTDAEWYLQTPFGVGTIYNYKDGVNYLGKKDGTPKTKIRDWHVGGTNKETYAYIIGYLKLK